MAELLQEVGEGWVGGPRRGSLSHGLHQCAESLGQAATLHLSFLSSKMEMMAQPSSSALSCCKDRKLTKAENDTPNVPIINADRAFSENIPQEASITVELLLFTSSCNNLTAIY